MATAFAAIANGGTLLRPYVVRRIVAPGGEVVLENEPTAVRRVISTRSARTTTELLRRVVEEEGGTGTKARLEEFQVAGKTGTAQKVDPTTGGYSSKRIGSFVGFVPADEPRAVILVLIDEPATSSYGGVVAEAVARGARAIVAEGEVAAKGSVPVVSVTGVRRVLARAAARLGGEPSAGLTLVGVTGTNGKTSTTFILEAIWLAAGLRAGVIGTVGYRFAGLDRPAPLTTPEAPVLQGLLAEMRRAGTTQVAMEVSSHALAQERVVGCRFDAAVFANLTRDHLDFHGDLDRYYRAKAGLFLEHLAAGGKPDPAAVVNVDDPAGRSE